MNQSVPVIAVVDDDAPFRRALRRLLRAAGYQVESFANAQEFLDVGHWEWVTCLVLDIQLPGMTAAACSMIRFNPDSSWQLV